MAPKPSNQGVALIITLAMIAMLTFLIVAFFSRSLANVQIESASTGTARADILTKGAAGIVVGDLQAEIVAGSKVSGSGTQPRVYTPLRRADAVPAVVRYPFTPADAPTFANLVKQSTGRFFPAGADYPNGNPVIQTVTPVTTDVATPNGRRVVTQRWDNPDAYNPLGPQLLVSSTTPTASRFTDNSMLPHWIMVTRQGVPAVQTDWVPAWKNYEQGKLDAAIGRFAYNVYDEGGLLDVNAAGYPETGAVTIPALAQGQKGTLGMARMSQIPGIDTSANSAKFISSWRNLASGETADGYLAFLGFTRNGGTDLTGNPFFMVGQRNGFLRPAVGTAAADNRILGRQDLIRLAVKAGSSGSSGAKYGLNTLALPYLTHFTRELNSPSWTPLTPTGSNIDYAAQADSATAANRSFAGVRVLAGASWTRLTGEPALEGEPLIKYRFPLSWLALVTRELTPEATAIVSGFDSRRVANGGTAIPGGSVRAKADWLVQRAFGLTWSTAADPTDGSQVNRWEYTGSAGGTTILNKIDVLGDVLKAGREPNFFELLKAGILSGSLGNHSDYESFCVNVGWDGNVDFHVVQIGANIIDQADADSFPTLIAFGFEYLAASSVTVANSVCQPSNVVKVFAGVEDLPYLQTVLGTVYRRPAGQPTLSPTSVDTIQNSTRDYFNGWVQFVVWKPQQQSVTTGGPTDYRILFKGSVGMRMLHYHPTPTVVFHSASFEDQPTSPVLPSGTTISFTDAPASFRSPTLLGGTGKTPTDGFSASQPNGNGGTPVTIPDSQMPRGMWLGEGYRPEKIYSAGSPNRDAPGTRWTHWQSGSDSSFQVQYLDTKGVWRTYQRYERFGMGTYNGFSGRAYGYADSPTDTKMQNAGSPVLPLVDGYPAYRALDIANFGVSAADPRSHRFGLMPMYVDVSTPPSPPVSWGLYLKQGWAPAGAVPNSGKFTPSGSRFTPSWTGGDTGNPWSNSGSPITDPVKFWADNSAGGTGYSDVDNVSGRRRGDGDSSNNVRPMQGAPSDLGLLLNRPFRSVGELGYVFRDEPYKSINLFTANSADSALLDIFSVTEQPALIAGKVNLNSKNPSVFQSVIVGASRDELSPTSNTISPDDALTIATNLVANTSDLSGAANKGPLLQPGDIANRLGVIMPVVSPGTSADPNTAIKNRREVVGRALAGSGQTRTWNLLVDIVGQSGRYNPGASKTENFIVEGEKRYWLHVAIDRYTGQVIDQQLEPVME